MAPRYQTYRLLHLPSLLLGAALLLAGLPLNAWAHQLSNVNGNLVPHQHVYKRNAYGNGYVSGHIVETRHGNNMIIWSPAPSSAFGNAVPQVQVVKPNRQRNLHPRQQTNPGVQGSRRDSNDDGR